MARPPIRPTGRSPRDVAEAVFKSATTKPAEPPPKVPVIPNARETVSLRIDRHVLDHFQADGPGWQDRINDALREIVARKAGREADTSIEADDLNASNDE